MFVRYKRTFMKSFIDKYRLLVNTIFTRHSRKFDLRGLDTISVRTNSLVKSNFPAGLSDAL